MSVRNNFKSVVSAPVCTVIKKRIFSAEIILGNTVVRWGFVSCLEK